MIQRQTFNIATDTGGDYADTGLPFHGVVGQVRYVPDATSPLDTGADIDIVGVSTGVVVASWDNIGSAAFTKVPQQQTHDTGGAAISGGRTFVWLGGEPLRVTVNQSAGVTGSKAGKIYIYGG